MKQHRLYIIMCILSLLFLAGCRDEEPVQSAESKRTITVNLGIAMSRVAEKDQVAYGDANDMKVWLFDQKGRCVQYIPVEDPQFSGRDITGDPVESVSTEFDVTDVESLQFRVLLNTDGLEDENGNPLVLGGETTIDEIDDLTFQFGTTMPDGDNKVPMYGKEKESITIDNKREYNVDIELVRAVGKLELFFTRENENSELTINSIKLEHVPIIGYMAAMPDPAPTGIYTGSEENILSFDSGETSVSILTTSDETLGNFSNDETNFTKLTLTNTYLLENPNGGTWSEVGSNNDYTYPYDEPSVSISDQDTRYVMTVDYSIGGTQKKQVVYLPAIERNVWNKIFARVKGGTLQIQYKAMPWETVVTSIGYAPQPVFPDEEGKTVFDSDDRYESEDYYVLLPKKEYDGKDTRSLMDELYTEAKSGDPEAVLCYVCRPGYVDNSKVDNLTYLKDGSGGARFYFMLTGPEGATWEAHLNDPEGNFAFSTTFEDSEFEDNADGYPVGVYKVTHGIARLKPYIIQIIATNNYTGTASGQNGTEEVEYPEINTDAGKQNWGGKEYFNDEYLTTWGEKQWKEKNVISAEFYITVKLTDGTEYELDINPSYNGYNQKAFSDEGFYYKDNRRYAGTDTRIWIRQLRAQYNGNHGIENYVDMAKHVDERSEDEWWRVNPYWNTDNE